MDSEGGWLSQRDRQALAMLSLFEARQRRAPYSGPKA